MRCLIIKSFLSFLFLFITLNTFATTDLFKTLQKRITTHPARAKQEILLYRKHAIAANNRLAVGKSYYLLGELYYTQAALPESAKAYKKGLTIFRELGNEAFEARANQGIGSLHLAMENCDKAIFFQRKNLHYQLQHGTPTGKAEAYFNIASTKACMQENDSAFYYYRVAEAIYQKAHDFESLSRVYLMTGYLYFSTGNNEPGLAYERQALRTAAVTHDQMTRQGALYAIGKIHQVTGKTDSARSYFLQAYALSDVVKNPDIECEICKSLSDVYEAQDSLKLSHLYLRRCQELKYMLLTPQKMHRINAIDFTGDDAQKTTDSGLIWWIIGPLLTVLIYFIYHRLTARSAEVSSEKPAFQSHELEERISNQQKELMSQTIRLKQQGELIEHTKSELTGLELNEQNRLRIRTLLSELKSTQQSSNWSEFERHFNDVHLDFYKKLLNDYPQLTVGERRLCGFISLNLSNKEISDVTRKSVRSIEVAKYRLRQKLAIPKEESLGVTLTKYL